MKRRNPTKQLDAKRASKLSTGARRRYLTLDEVRRKNAELLRLAHRDAITFTRPHERKPAFVAFGVAVDKFLALDARPARAVTDDADEDLRPAVRDLALRIAGLRKRKPVVAAVVAAGPVAQKTPIDAIPTGNVVFDGEGTDLAQDESVT